MKKRVTREIKQMDVAFHNYQIAQCEYNIEREKQRIKFHEAALEKIFKKKKRV